jgi:hypothetical protein
MGSGRLRSVGMIAIFDLAGPLVTYTLLSSAGLGPVTALVLSGVFPAAGVIIGISRHRRADVVGVVVLAGIMVGAILGLVSHNAKLVLNEGSVPTAVFGLLCLGSLGTPKPLMYRLALEFTGPDTPKGRELTAFWQHEEFRRIFRLITTVWGTASLTEAAARVIIVQYTPVTTALAVSKVLPYAMAAVLVAWTVGYGQYRKRKGEHLTATHPNQPEPIDAQPPVHHVNGHGPGRADQ